MADWIPVLALDIGHTVYLSTEPQTVDVLATSKAVRLQAALLDVQLPVLGVDGGSADVTLPTEIVSPATLRAAGVTLEGRPCELALLRVGDYWEERTTLLRGRVAPDGVARDRRQTTLSLTDYAEQLDREFPPYVFDERAFTQLGQGSLSSRMQVIYGACNDIPLVQLDELTEDTDPTTSIRFAVACHRLASQKLDVYPNGDTANVVTALTVQYMTEPYSGALVAYVEIPVTTLRDSGSGLWVANVRGHRGDADYFVQGLGDVIEHALRNYSGLEPERIDWQRLARFKPRANAIAIASPFGGSSGGDTLISTLKSRYEQTMPIALSWRNGKLGADWLRFDEADSTIRTLRWGRDLIEQEGAIVSDQGAPFTEFSLLYDVTTLALDVDGNPKPRAVTRKTSATHEVLAAARTRYGRIPHPPVTCSDINAAASAGVVLDGLVDRFAVKRLVARYRVATEDAIGMTLFGRYAIVDDDMGFDEEPFRLEAIEFALDDTATITLRSYRSA